MSVVVIGPAYPLRGGIAAYTQRLSMQFVQEGFKTKVFTFSMQYPSFLFPGKTQYSSDAPPENLDIDVSINSVNPFNWISVGRKIRKMKPSLVVFNYWLPLMAPCYGTIARIIRSNPSIIVIAVIHNMKPHEKRSSDNILSRYFINSCSGYLTMTRQVDEDLSQFTSSKNRVISPHPVYDNYGTAVSKHAASQFLNLNDTTSYLLFFGLVRKYKGLDLLFEAMADERIKKLPVKLIVAGEFYDYRTEYESLARQLNIYDDVIMIGDYIPDDAVKFYFSIADAVVLPYRNATQSGIASLALHFDKPMIVSNFGGLPDAVIPGETGFVTGANAAEIADAIHRFYTEINRDDMVEKVKSHKTKYSWSHVVNSLLQLSRQIKNHDHQK